MDPIVVPLRSNRRDASRAGHCAPAIRAAQPSSRLTPLAALVLLLCSGCAAVGPDFKTPSAPASEVQAYTASPLPAQTAAAAMEGGASQRFQPGADVPAEWWTLFRSEPLDRLIRAALEHNPNLAAARDALREAQENFAAESGQLRAPQVNGNLLGQRQQPSRAGGHGGGAFNLYNASVDVAYSPDVFGGARRQLESGAAAVDYERFEVEATYLTLVANVATTAIREASLRAQLQATREVLALEDKQVAVVEAQLVAGAVGRAPVLEQQTLAAQTRATLPALEKELAQVRHQLAAYTGRLPGEDGLPELDLASLHLPETLPLTLPSAVVRQRPDIRASEAQLHAASAEVGVAKAALYPSLTLSGNLGVQALKAADLFGPGGGVWSLAGGLTQPLFHGGALHAKERAAQAAYDEAEQQYRATVLLAFANVADTLRAIEFDAVALQRLAEAEALAKRSLDLTTSQYKLGAVSHLALLDVQRSYSQARVALVQAEAARYADTAALFQALGGGWWNQPAASQDIQQAKETS